MSAFSDEWDYGILIYIVLLHKEVMSLGINCFENSYLITGELICL